MGITKEEYFKRQTTLQEFGVEKQQLLQDTKVLIVGCGGLGGPAAIYLATSGIGHIHLIDFDKVSISNIHRQVFFNTSDVGKFKSEVIANVILQKAPFTNVTFSTTKLSKETVLDVFEDYNIIVDATDSMATKYLINDACVLLKKPLVYGSLYKFDGYVSVFNLLQKDGSYSCNLRDAFPSITYHVPNCEEAGTLNPIVGSISLMQVNEVLKIATNLGQPLIDRLLIYNALENTFFKMKLKPNPDIDIKELFNSSNYIDAYCDVQNKSLLISANELKGYIKEDSIEIISVLNHNDSPMPFTVHLHKPYRTFDENEITLDIAKKYAVVCKKGITSYDVVLKLKKKYPLVSVYSLEDGIDGFMDGH